MRNYLLLILLCIGPLTSFVAQTDTEKRIVIPHVSPSLKLIENLGQWEPNILFKARLDGGAMFVEHDGLTFNFYDKKKFRSLHRMNHLKEKPKDLNIQGHAYKVHFEKCNSLALVNKAQEGKDYENYFIGNDPSKWKGNVKNYHQVWLRDLYPGIDYELITATSGLKYNFHVKAGANPANIAMRYEGVEDLRLNKGSLYVKLTVNEVMEYKPYCYQMINGEIREVKCEYKLQKNVLSFHFPEGYDRKNDLVIDPVLVFAAQSGSPADNFGMTATFDPQGNLYSGGTVFDAGYPYVFGSYSSVFNGPAYYGNTDVFITKYNSTGNSLIYSTYFGGAFSESVNSMIVDNNNNLCFFGVTSSHNLPTGPNAYDPSFNGGTPIHFVQNGMRMVNGTDIYIAKFNSSGSALLAGTYLGGAGNDGLNYTNHVGNIWTIPAVPPNPGTINVPEPAYDSLLFNYGDQCRGEIMTDAAGNIYITSSTRSIDFPTVNGFDNTLNGKQDGVIAKFNSALSNLIHSSYIGGSSNDAGYGIIVQDNFEIYVTGGTCSQDFPFTTGGYQSNYQGGKSDGFVLRISPSGNTVLNGSYFGTSNYDQSFFIQSDKYNNIYIYGQSLGSIPVIMAPNETTIFSVPGTHQFISRFRPDLSALNMSTTFGNYAFNTDLSPCAFSVDKCNNIYISGWGGSVLAGAQPMQNMPLFNATQSTTNGFDFYFMGLDSNAKALKYGSYFGGALSSEHVDGGTSRFDPSGKIYQSACAGCGGFDDFPVTPGAWPNTPGNPNHSGNCNNGVVKLDFQLQLSVATINTNTLSGCMPLSVTFTNATPPGGPNATFKWYLGNGITTTTTINPSLTYTAPGVYTVALVVRDNLTCNKMDSTITFVTVYSSPVSSVSMGGNFCSKEIIFTPTASGNLGPNPFLWNFGDGSPFSNVTAPTHTYSSNGNFVVSYTVTDLSGCTETKTLAVNIFDFNPGVVRSGTICYGTPTVLTAEGGTSYTWTPSASLSNGFIDAPVANPTVTTIYTVVILNGAPGYNCSKTLTTQLIVNPTPTTNFSFSVNPCGGGVQYTDLSEEDIVSWTWTLSPTRTSTLQHPYYFYEDGGTFTVNLTTANAYNCKHSFSQLVTVGDPPDLEVSQDSAICRGNVAQLHASGGVSYLWSPPQHLNVPTSSDPVASPLVSTEYSVEIKTDNSCTFLLTTFVRVDLLSNTPISAYANPVLVTTGDPTTLTYIGQPGATVQWLPAGSTTPPIGYTVNAYPDKPTTYTVVASRGVCEEDLTVYVEAYTSGCLESDVFIPNTFTPNGDGQNDLLYVRGLKVDEVFFAVYNRWGEKVFETNDPNEGWNGRYKGKDVDVGVFGWYLKVKCLNGEETFKKGNVTLIR